MNLLISILCIVLIALSAFFGYKKGALRGLCGLLIFMSVTIISYVFKTKICNLLIENFPFFNFKGIYQDVQAINFYIYDLVSFLVIFVVLYCILNIILSLGSFDEIVKRVDMVYELPSKIGGAIIGAVNGALWIFIFSVSLLMIVSTQKYVMESAVPRAIVQKMPIINGIFASESASAQNMYISNQKYLEGEERKVFEANMEIVRNLIKYKVVDSSLVNKCINDNKIPELANVVVAS